MPLIIDWDSWIGTIVALVLAAVTALIAVAVVTLIASLVARGPQGRLGT
jgi:hypothetical protein